MIASNANICFRTHTFQLRAAISDTNQRAGIDVMTGQVGDMYELGIFESLKVKLQVLLSATEAAEMILRVDDIIKCAPRQREE